MEKDDSSPSHNKSKDRRPPNLAISKVHSENHKWRECKIIGRNISIRSYSAACAFRNKYLIIHLESIFMEAIRSSMELLLISTIFGLMTNSPHSVGSK